MREAEQLGSIGPIVEPADGYPDDISKEAVTLGAIDALVAMPTSRGVVDGLPINSAEDALAILHRGNGDQAQSIKAASLTLGSASFVTDTPLEECWHCR